MKRRRHRRMNLDRGLDAIGNFFLWCSNSKLEDLSWLYLFDMLGKGRNVIIEFYKTVLDILLGQRVVYARE